MKNITLILLFIFLSTCSFGQITGAGRMSNQKATIILVDRKNAVSVNLSSYSLIVIDYERLIGKNIGVTLGFLPLGGEIAGSYFFKPQLNSSSVGLKLGIDWNPITDITSLPKIGTFFQYKSNKIFTAKAEIGVHNYTYWDYGYSYYYEEQFTDFGLYFDIRIGIYFPW